MEQRYPPLLVSILCIGFAVLYLPILVLIGYSFNASPLISVWGGFSTSWYVKLLHNRELLDAGLLSLEVAVAASTAAVVLGTLAAIALVRFARFPGRLLLTGMVTAPLVMPEVITGTTQLLLFVSLLQTFSWPHRGFLTIVLAHITFCIAYVTVTVQSRLQGADRSLEEAAQDLGAGPTRAFLEITLPLISPAIVSSWLLSFTLSLDDLVISSFVTGPGATTLPMLIYSKVKLGVSPDINALASLIIAVVGSCVVFAGWLMRRTERQRELEMRMAERADESPKGAAYPAPGAPPAPAPALRSPS
jgi:putrescine transport system permease protein